MKVITYQQLRKLPPDTFFSTLSASNELGELWLTGEYPWGLRFIYSVMSDVSGAGRKEVDFEDNIFDRKGHFLAWSKEELKAYVETLKGVLKTNSAPVASEGGALYHPMLGGVATSASAANAALQAAHASEPRQTYKHVGHFFEQGNRLRFAGFGDTVFTEVKLTPAYALETEGSEG